MFELYLFFSGVKETLIESDIDGHDSEPPMKDEEEVDYLFKDVEEVSNSIRFDSSCTCVKEHSNFLGSEDVIIGLGSLSLSSI